MTPPLYAASVPVFRHYLDRAEGLALKTRGQPELLSARLRDDMFPAGEQLAVAAQFTQRIAFPLAGHTIPPETGGDFGLEGVRARIISARRNLDPLDPAAFEGAETRVISHQAGFALLEQTGADFLHLFGMPNFLFHLSMAFAILRSQGIEIGKADFDGQHDYPSGFRF